MAKRRKRTRRAASGPLAMRKIQPMVAGVDLGSEEHWVCGPARADEQPNVEVFRSTTAGLEAMVDWLLTQGVHSVAMESTHVYWIPLYDLLESAGLEVLLVNARQLHNVPGRKTDMSDCQWLQLLHSCGLLRGSFRPHESICAMRALRRQMANLVEQRTRSVQWMQQALDQMNVQVHRAVSDITGKTGMAIIRAIASGDRDPLQLAALRDKRCRKSQAEIAEHLTGSWREEHLFNLERSLYLYDLFQTLIASYEARLLEYVRQLQPPERREELVPVHPNTRKEKAIRARGDHEARQELWRFCGVDLTRIDAISSRAALVVLTEVGNDVSMFPDEHHFVSWLRLSPRTPFSAGKPLKKKRNGMGATRVASVLRMAALSLSRSKTALGAYFRRIARRKDGAVAMFATARKLAQLIYRMLRYGQDYVDIGQDAYEANFDCKRLRGITNAAEQLGYKLVPLAAAEAA